MVKSRFILAALILLPFGCAEDKKQNSTPSTSIAFNQLAKIDYNYGSYFPGYKQYSVDLTSNTLSGRWDRLSTDTPDSSISRVQATATLQLSAAQIQELETLMTAVNDSTSSVDQSKCGMIQDGSIESLVLIDKQAAKKIQIAETKDLGTVCADVYVTEKALQPVFDFFQKLMPEPEDPSAYKPKTN